MQNTLNYVNADSLNKEFINYKHKIPKEACTLQANTLLKKHRQKPIATNY